MYVDESLFNETTGWRFRSWAPIDHEKKYHADRRRSHEWNVLSIYTLNDYLPCTAIKKNGLMKKNYTIESRINCCLIATLFRRIDRLSSWIMFLYTLTLKSKRWSRRTIVKCDIFFHILPISIRSNLFFLF